MLDGWLVVGDMGKILGVRTYGDNEGNVSGT